MTVLRNESGPLNQENSSKSIPSILIFFKLNLVLYPILVHLTESYSSHNPVLRNKIGPLTPIFFF